jgi:hypothetical protein
MGKHNLNAQSNNESEYVRAVTRLDNSFVFVTRPLHHRSCYHYIERT